MLSSYGSNFAARARVLRTAVAVALAATLAATGAESANAGCSPFPCSQVIVPLPHQLDFGADHGGVRDGRGTGTGFTYVAPPRTDEGFEPSRLLTGDGLLRITTGTGINYRDVNTLENALAVGVPASARVFSAHTTLDRPPLGTWRWEQGGLWLGTDQDNYLKLVVLAHASQGIGVEFLGEARGQSPTAPASATFARRFVAIRDLHNMRVTLVMRADVEAGTVAAFYAVQGGGLQHVATFAPPRELLAGGERVDPTLAGARLAGVFATHRLGGTPLEYRFDRFDIACHDESCPASIPDPGPGGPASNVIDPETGPSGGADRRATVVGWSDDLRVTLRHPRRVRASRLASRGLPILLRCSKRCSMRARMLGSRRWARTAALRVERFGIALGGGHARVARAGLARGRLTVARPLKDRVRSVAPGRVAIEARVTSAGGRRVLLRSSVKVRR
jgi:hypothetical protein